MSDPVLRLDRVTTVFATGVWPARRRIVATDAVTFDVPAGQTVGLVGESGSGKTTVGWVALGLRRPTAGTVLLLGRPYRDRTTRVGKVQAVLQNPQWSLNPRLHVGESVAEPLCAVHGGRPRTYAADAGAMLEQVGLDRSYAQRFPHELSGGQRQRVAIARALVTKPRFIVFDEAVSALDLSVQAQILNLIKDLQAEHGFGALFISHDLGAVRYLAHRVAVMRAGRIVELADAQRFYEAPDHEYSRQLLEAL